MPDASGPARSDPLPRRRWMGLLARATRDELESAWSMLAPPPSYTVLRKAETGLVLVRGRIGGSGSPFNLGEMTMTRCAVHLDRPPHTTGLSFVAGRDQRHAELAAAFDALLQDAHHHDDLHSTLLAGIEARLAESRRRVAGEVAATRVEFFTMVRERA